MLVAMIESRTTWVAVEAHALDDLVALAVMAADRLDLRDSLLSKELVGAAANVHASRETLLFPDMET